MFIRKQILQVNCKDLEKLIAGYYDLKLKDVELVAIEEWNNGSEHLFDVEKEELDEHEKKDIISVRTGKLPLFSLGTILKDMCYNNVIEPGEYLITVFW